MPSLAQPASLDVSPNRLEFAAERLDSAAFAILRWSLVAILLYFGAFKFTQAEAEGIRPLLGNSPLFAWLYAVASAQAVSNAIGIFEIALAASIAARRISPLACAAGSVLAAALFVVTLSFLFTTPGGWVSVPGFPLPVPGPAGAFLIKDVFLLGAALWSAAESLSDLRSGSRP